MSFGSGILDDIRDHIRDCKTCRPLQPGGGADNPNNPNTQLAIKQCSTYAALHRDWKRWTTSPDF